MVERFRCLEVDYREMVMQHQWRLADERELQRRTFRTREEWIGERERIRSNLLTSLGAFPEERTPLNAKITGRLERDGYVVEKIAFESRPNFFVTANLYLPEEVTCPAPAVLSVHGHWSEAKHQPTVQARCIGLALRGYVVLQLDKPGYGERAPQGHHEVMCLLLAGQTLQGLQVWDNLRAIDYLCSRPEVNKERIGMTGASGGGNQTMYTTAVDDRIKAAVPVCSVCMYEDRFRQGVGCACEIVPNVLRYANGCDICALIAPRPLLMIHGTRDGGFSVQSARRVMARLKNIYALFSATDAVAAQEFDAPHEYNREMRQAMYAWFDRWLMGKMMSDPEPEIWTESARSDALNVFPVGEFPKETKTVMMFYQEFCQTLPPFNAPATNPLSWKQNVERRRRRLVEEIFGGFPERRDLSVRSSGVVERAECTIEKIMFHSDRDVFIPALVFKPKITPLLAPGVVYLTPDGKSAATERREVSRLVGTGCVVLAMDYRGIGETGTDDNIAARNGFTLGKPIFGERVWDVMRGLDYLALRQEIDAQRLYVYGEAAAGLIALYAAAVDERVQVACADRFLVSYKPQPSSSPTAAPAPFAEPLSNFLPNILTLGDVNDIASWAAPRQLLLANGVFPDGTHATREEMQRIFARTREAYSLHGREDRLRVTVASSENVWQEFMEACSRR